MSNNDWAKAYATPENIVNRPTGKTVRPFPGGQKIGMNLPVQNSPFSAQTNSKVIQVAEYTNSMGFEIDDKTTVVDISTPSRRIACGVQVYFELPTKVLSGQIPIGITPPVATLVEMAVNPQSGATCPMRTIQSLNIPGSFDVEHIYRDVRLTLQLNNNNIDWAALGANYARLMVVANWEPNCEIANDELARLYGLCSISVPGVVRV